MSGVFIVIYPIKTVFNESHFLQASGKYVLIMCINLCSALNGSGTRALHNAPNKQKKINKLTKTEV